MTIVKAIKVGVELVNCREPQLTSKLVLHASKETKIRQKISEILINLKLENAMLERDFRLHVPFLASFALFVSFLPTVYSI